MEASITARDQGWGDKGKEHSHSNKEVTTKSVPTGQLCPDRPIGLRLYLRGMFSIEVSANRTDTH